jgi:hypothetical protein
METDHVNFTALHVQCPYCGAPPSQACAMTSTGLADATFPLASEPRRCGAPIGRGN